MKLLKAIEIIHARGHANIKATHKTTIEITKDGYLTERGDCIIGVSADKAAADLSDSFKRIAKRNDSLLVIVISVGGVYDIILAQGSQNLVLADDRKIIIRKSTFIEPATVAIRANKAAADIRRDLVELLRQGGVLTLELYAITLDEINPKYSSPRAVL
ncbi:DUF371 domain-containing protein [Thermogladius sp. 4427co]|uniref:DUF371 domain-containing protein n=1 Tax=Thermogladius sp. 4427co TaxID=3450718 RepID=UPI003F7A0124